MINFTKKNVLGIIQGFCSKISEDLFYRKPPYTFVENKLGTVSLR